MRIREAYVCRACGELVAIGVLHLHDPDQRTVLSFLFDGGCQRLDDHDHADPRLPEYFHAWLRGERRRAPGLRSWLSERNIDQDASDHSAESSSTWHETNAGLFAA